MPLNQNKLLHRTHTTWTELVNVSKEQSIGAGIVVLWVKPLPVKLASHMSTSLNVGLLCFQNQLLVKVPRKALEDVSKTWAPVTHLEALMEFLSPGHLGPQRTDFLLFSSFPFSLLSLLYNSVFK